MFWFLFAFCIPIQCDHIAFSDVPFTRSMERSAICGVLCAERAISLLKDDSPSLDTLICKKYITSPNGSSIEDLERLLRDHGCEVLSRTNVSTPFCPLCNLLRFSTSGPNPVFQRRNTGFCSSGTSEGSFKLRIYQARHLAFRLPNSFQFGTARS